MVFEQLDLVAGRFDHGQGNLRAANAGNLFCHHAFLVSAMREFESKQETAEQGLYDPAQEHDACGVGFVANLRGKLQDALESKGLF